MSVPADRPRLAGIGTALPEREYKQDEIIDVLFGRLPGWDPAWAEVFSASGVRFRAAAVDVESFYAGTPATAERMAAFTPAARALGGEASRRALAAAGAGSAAGVADLLAVSCTGYAGPGLDVHLVADLGLEPTTHRLGIGHMGCFAALPALRTATALSAASGKAALLACVELCSLHLQPAATRLDIVSQALFGDGAGAVVVRPGADGPAVVGSSSRTIAATEDRMGWTVADDGFRMSLSPRVPALVERAVPGLLADLLTPHGLATADIDHWVVHPGGPEVLERVQRGLGLGDDALSRSWTALSEGGNRSSATVLFILEALLRSGEVEAGQWIVMLAFGTGLTCEALLLQA